MAPASQTPKTREGQPPESTTLPGGCLCGAVRFQVSQALLSPVAICHCSQCRRFHGHVAAYTSLPADELRLIEASGLAWYASSPGVSRGFCRRCGASLFWRREGGKAIDVAAGSLDGPTGLTMRRHIWVASRGDYYPIAGDLPRYPGTAPF